MALHNRINNRILKDRLQQLSHANRKTLSFYAYHIIESPHTFREELYAHLNKLNVWGRIYVSYEGINAQVSIPLSFIENFKKYLKNTPFSHQIKLNMALEDTGKSFFKLKILVRKKIVADGLNDNTFDVTRHGMRLDAAAFNRLTDKADTVVIDMRNHYESEIGHFRNAICPDADTFRNAIPMVEKILEKNKNKNIILYCTGGIRCEKTSAWFKHLGFNKIYQLDGGIINYIRQVREKNLENKFIGKNFVFDERLGEQISPDIISSCHQCGTPCNTHVNCKNDGCHLLFIQCDNCNMQFDGCCSPTCQHIITLPKEEQKKMRKGINTGRQVFKKGRFPNLQAF